MGTPHLLIFQNSAPHISFVLFEALVLHATVTKCAGGGLKNTAKAQSRQIDLPWTSVTFCSLGLVDSAKFKSA